MLLTAFMVLTQLFIVCLLGVQSAGRLLTARAGIQLEVLPGATEQQIQSLYGVLKAHPSVRSVVYIPKEKAYERQKARDPELVSFLEEYNLENPFPDSFAVTLTSLDSFDTFVAAVQKPEWKNVISASFLSSASNGERDIRSLLEVTGGLHALSIFFIVIAFALLFFVILEWVSRATVNRGHELLLEHLLGAPPAAVVLPFATEMTLLLLAGAVLGTLIVGALIVLLPVIMPALAFEAAFRQFQTELRPMLLTFLPLFLLLEVLVMPALAYAGTVIGVRKHMPASFVLFP